MEYKTSESQRKAVKSYSEKVDRINTILPSGTHDRLDKLGIEKHSTFIKELVLAELDRMEKYKK